MYTLPAMSDLEFQLAAYLQKLSGDLEDLQLNPNFSDGVESLYRDANMFVLLALAIATSPEKSEIKAAAPGMIVAARALTKVASFEEANAAFSKLQQAINTVEQAPAPQWEKTVALAPVMKKAIPALSTDIKRLTRNERNFGRGTNADKVLGASAALAVAAIGCRPNVAETLAPTETELWETYCHRLYETTMAFNAAAHKAKDGSGTFDDMSKAFEKVEETCNSTCHEKFGGATK